MDELLEEIAGCGPVERGRHFEGTGEDLARLTVGRSLLLLLLLDLLVLDGRAQLLRHVLLRRGRGVVGGEGGDAAAEVVGR